MPVYRNNAGTAEETRFYVNQGGTSTPITLYENQNGSAVELSTHGPDWFYNSQTTTPADDNANTTTNENGLGMTLNGYFEGVRVRLSANISGATEVVLRDSLGGSIVATADITNASPGDYVDLIPSNPIEAKAVAGADAAGAEYTRGRYESPTYPYTSNVLSIDEGVYTAGGSTSSAVRYNFDEAWVITSEDPYASTTRQATIEDASGGSIDGGWDTNADIATTSTWSISGSNSLEHTNGAGGGYAYLLDNGSGLNDYLTDGKKARFYVQIPSDPSGISSDCRFRFGYGGPWSDCYVLVWAADSGALRLRDAATFNIIEGTGQGAAADGSGEYVVEVDWDSPEHVIRLYDYNGGNPQLKCRIQTESTLYNSTGHLMGIRTFDAGYPLRIDDFHTFS